MGENGYVYIDNEAQNARNSARYSQASQISLCLNKGIVALCLCLLRTLIFPVTGVPSEDTYTCRFRSTSATVKACVSRNTTSDTAMLTEEPWKQ